MIVNLHDKHTCFVSVFIQKHLNIISNAKCAEDLKFRMTKKG